MYLVILDFVVAKIRKGFSLDYKISFFHRTLYPKFELLFHRYSISKRSL